MSLFLRHRISSMSHNDVDSSYGFFFRSSCMISFFISFLTLWHLTTEAWGNIVTAWCHKKGNHSWVSRCPESSHHRKEQKWAFQCLSCTSKTVDKGRRSGCKWRNNSVYLYTFFYYVVTLYQRTAMSDLAPQSGAAHNSTTSLIRNPSTGAALPLRGGLASIEGERKFLPASD